MGSDDQQKIEALGDVVLHEAIGLAQAALDEIPSDGGPTATADGDAKARGTVVITAERAGHEGMGDASFAGGKKFIEARFTAEALVAGEGGAGFWIGGGHGWNCSGDKKSRAGAPRGFLNGGRIRAGG